MSKGSREATKSAAGATLRMGAAERPKRPCRMGAAERPRRPCRMAVVMLDLIT